jgi:c-di-GMP-binding flagellar brake protein YcgR
MLMLAHRQFEKKEKLAVEIQLPSPVEKTIETDAVVIRINQVRKGSYFVAVKFTNMDSETCDDIMAFCFAEQRRMLREHVLTRDL